MSKYSILVDWVRISFGDMLNGVPSDNPTRFKYGMTDGIFDVAKTEKGIAVLVSATAQFALIHFDRDNIQSCEYFSFTGAGLIILNGTFYLILIAAGISLVAVILLQLGWW